ncbi:hypothetical protein A2U01_0083413, partial [Trifolium medium]|nr:hypothetical protein [Trifolium medium]
AGVSALGAVLKLGKSVGAVDCAWRR